MDVVGPESLQAVRGAKRALGFHMLPRLFRIAAT